MRTGTSRVVLVVFAAVALLINPDAEGQKSKEQWVASWSAAVHTPLTFPGLPPTPIIDNQTVRMVVRPTIGGQRIRVRFSNTYGTSALEIGAASIALTDHGSVILPNSNYPLTFGGATSVKIPAGAPMLSDPVDLKVSPFAEISISIYLPHKTEAATTHFWAQHETYITGSGDFTKKSELQNPSTTTSWYWLADLEVSAPGRSAAIVAFGDSITDGVGAKQGEYGDWPDLLARHLAETPGSTSLAVLNEGIGGNRIWHDGAGVNALARFDRDVLAQPGVTDVIILEGINDIGWPRMKPRTTKEGEAPSPGPFAGETVSAQDLILGFRQLIDRAHQHGIRIFGATLTPYEDADYFSQDGEADRQEVNQWIRSSRAFDGVVDFDMAVRDPTHPSRFREEYQSGDHLHPSTAGYKAMAGAIDIDALRGGRRR
jgi:lysophospholipase L1-like esterase